MNDLYAPDELLDATGGELRNSGGAGIGSISIDSREVAPGALFVAIKGEKFDGHDFVPAAIEAGADLCMVSADQADRFPGLPLLVVADALEGLTCLARKARQRSGAKIVAVTGSAGKTTTKEAIRLVFEAAGRTHASIRSFNNHWGVPLMLARMPRDTEYAVFEIGMNHAGEIEPLSRLVRPHIAVVTTIAPAHLEFFDSVSGIARAKSEIFAGLEPDGTAVIGVDHEHVALLEDAVRQHGFNSIIRFGFSSGADAPITGYLSDGETSSFSLGLAGGEVKMRIAASGRHMASNAAAALCVANACQLEIGRSVEALRGFGASVGRGAVNRLGDADNPLVLIDESYNANPASMRAALEVFGSHPQDRGRKVLVLGDMLELGTASAALHAELAGPVTESGADLVFLAGRHMASLAGALGPDRVMLHAPEVADLTQAVLDQLANGDTVMVKGSNGVGLSGLVVQIRSRFGAPGAAK